jgi:hypothetical protein
MQNVGTAAPRGPPCLISETADQSEAFEHFQPRKRRGIWRTPPMQAIRR